MLDYEPKENLKLDTEKQRKQGNKDELWFMNDMNLFNNAVNIST